MAIVELLHPFALGPAGDDVGRPGVGGEAFQFQHGGLD